jgi:uncharacterized membrane protein
MAEILVDLAPFDARVRRGDLAPGPVRCSYSRWWCAVGEFDWSGQVIELGDDMHTMPPQGRQRHPVVVAHQAQRAADLQLWIADQITAFAESMPFVYLHAALFGIWMLFIESTPWPMLTLVVSLEAILLSTFVMIGQNRQSAFQQAKADHDFNEQELELKTNTELTRAIHTLTTELHRRLLDEPTR